MMTTQTRTLNWILPSLVSTNEINWEALYQEQLPRIYNFFRYRIGNEIIAEDLTSITFEKAWRAKDRYRQDLAAFSTWLFAIARNVAADHFRRNHSEISLDEIVDHTNTDTPECLAVRRADFKRLSSLLKKLSDREREIIALKYGADLTNRAIAQITGLSESNIGTILHRTIQSLRTQW